jgi:hypothetical protein
VVRWGSAALAALALALVPAGRAAALPQRPAGTPYRIVVLPVKQRGTPLPPRRGLARTFRSARAWYRRETRGRIDLRAVFAPPIAAAAANAGEDGPAATALRIAAGRGVDVAGALPVLIEAGRRDRRSYGSPSGIQIRGTAWRRPQTVVHELGHGLGLEHSPAPTACRGGFAPLRCTLRPRTRYDYADALDVMGGGDRHLGAYARVALGLDPVTDAPPGRAVTVLRPLEARRPTLLRLRTAAFDYLVDTRRADVDRIARRRVRAPRGAAIARVRARYAPAGATSLVPEPVRVTGGGNDLLPQPVRVPATDPARACRAGTPACLARQIFRPGRRFTVPGAVRLRVLRGGGALRVATRWLDRTPPSLTVAAARIVRPAGAPAQLALALATAATGAGVARIEVEQGGAITPADPDLHPGLVAGPRGSGTLRVPLRAAPVARVRAVDAAGNASAWQPIDLAAVPAAAGATVSWAPAGGTVQGVATPLGSGQVVTIRARTDPALAGALAELEVVGSAEAPSATVGADGTLTIAWTAPRPGLYTLRLRVPVGRSADGVDVRTEAFQGWYRG